MTVQDIEAATSAPGLRLPAVPASVPELRGVAQRWAERARLGSDRIAAVALAVTEAATNAVLHAFVGREPGTVTLRIEPRDGEVAFRVVDDGRGLTPRIDSPGLGLGLPTIGRLADHLEVGPAPEGGTEVLIVFEAPGIGDPAQALRERLAGAYADLHEAVLVHDDEGRFAYANAPALALLGLEADDLTARRPGQTVAEFDVRLPDGSPVALDDWPHRRLFRGDARPAPLITRSVHLATGRTRWTETTATLLVDEPSGRRLSLGTVRDVTEAVEAAARDRLLARAGQRLQLAAVDLEGTFEEIAAAAVPEVADWCAVDVAGDDGILRRVALAHRDPEKVALGRAIHDRWPPDPADETGVYGVLRSGAPLVLPQLTAEAFDVLEDEERRRALQDLGMRSVVVVAMRGRARTIGLLTLVHAESGRAFGEADVAFAQELADRAGVAVENARLIDRAGPPADGAS